jgi:transcriptional regulator
VVPTWNYQAVHVTGRLEIIDDAAEKHTIVTQLTERFENARAKPWAVSDAPDGYIAGQLKGIVGVVLHIRTIDGKVKLSQNRSEQDQLGVIHGLETENPSLAAAMRRYREREK